MSPQEGANEAEEVGPWRAEARGGKGLQKS